MAVLNTGPVHNVRSLVRRIGALFALLALAAAGPSASGASATATEPEIKSVFIFNFTRFVTWPAGSLPPDQPITIGVMGNDPTGDLIESVIKGEVVDGHSLVLKRFTRPEEIANCQMLFVARSEAFRLPAILERVKGQPILTVSDIDRFVYLGGMIGLPTEDGRVRVQINLDHARSEKLNLSAKLLRPAQLVIQQKPQTLRLRRGPAQGFVVMDELLCSLLVRLSF